MQKQYRDIDELITMFKNETNSKLIDEMFLAIKGHLVHHINAVISILKGTNYEGKRSIYELIRTSFMRSMHIKNVEDLSVLTMLTSMMDTNDIQQEIDYVIFQLLNIYVPGKKYKFYEFVSYLLPRRILSSLWKQSKDAASQFNTILSNDYQQDETINIDTSIYINNEHDFLDEHLYFLDDQTFDMLESYYNGSDYSEIAKQEGTLPKNIEQKLKMKNKQTEMTIKSIERFVQSHNSNSDTG